MVAKSKSGENTLKLSKDDRNSVRIWNKHGSNKHRHSSHKMNILSAALNHLLSCSFGNYLSLEHCSLWPFDIASWLLLWAYFVFWLKVSWSMNATCTLICLGTLFWPWCSISNTVTSDLLHRVGSHGHGDLHHYWERGQVQFSTGCHPPCNYDVITVIYVFLHTICNNAQQKIRLF